ncbi:HlyD family secretion protein [uncultured Ramlibacter sp.]|uniref:HlyD family secretion protein n=1 Tax=uncultured Ramlibacter sp. TaxID=260755 RepID=UPI002614DC0B|nr:HlyD family secretion protein [uncultured Ramlibacter sp.]
MTQDATPAAPVAAPAPDAAGRGTRIGTIVLLLLIGLSLILYFAGDRLTPYTSQARIQAFVVPVAGEVGGKILKVHIRNDDVVKPGQLLFEIDPNQYAIALQRARSDYESLRGSIGASAAGVDAARASLRAAKANQDMAARDASRLERLHQEDPGAISVRRLEIAQSTREESIGKTLRSEADLRKAIEAAGSPGEDNTQMVSAKTAIEKAELDLARTKVLAPAAGTVTDLRVDIGQFVQPGAPMMTLIARHDLWINAAMTENNLGNIRPGNEVEIALDVMPGKILKGRVRSIGSGVGSGQQSPPGTLPTVENNRDWLRQAQRIPVMIEFQPGEIDGLRGLPSLRIGGQAEVLVYTGDRAIMNPLGALYIRVMSWLSYLY